MGSLNETFSSTLYILICMQINSISKVSLINHIGCKSLLLKVIQSFINLYQGRFSVREK